MYSVIAIVMVWVRDRRISPGMLLLAQLALPTVGFYLLQKQDGNVSGGTFVLLAPALIALGMVLGPTAQTRIFTGSKNHKLHSYLKIAFSVVFILAILHFALGGIPVLSDSVETQRFNLGASGLGGFPSRAVLYALPALALISLATVTSATQRITIGIWALYVVTRLAMGFKGALLEVIFLVTIAYLIRIGKPKAKHLALLAAGLIGALIYVEAVRSLYATSATGADNVAYILDRSTKQAIESGYLALFYSPDLASGSTAFWSDFQQLLSRYTGNAGSGDYTFDMLMSSIVTGTPLGVGKFIVPVTVGGAVYLLFSMPIPAAALALVILGWVWSWAIQALRRLDSIFAGVAAALLIAGIRMFILNGNGAYLIINLIFTACLLWMCAIPIWLGKLHSSRKQTFTQGNLKLKAYPNPK